MRFSSGDQTWAPIGSSAVSLEWCATRAMAVGATDDEIAEVLLATAPVAGLGRIASAAPDVATALGYDVAAAPVAGPRIALSARAQP